MFNITILKTSGCFRVEYHNNKIIHVGTFDSIKKAESIMRKFEKGNCKTARIIKNNNLPKYITLSESGSYRVRKNGILLGTFRSLRLAKEALENYENRGY